MKKILSLLILLVAGLAVGGGAGFATVRYIAPPKGAAAETKEAAPTGFVAAEKVLAPLVLGDGRLAGYVVFDAQLEVPAAKVDELTAKLPLLLHAINMRTYRTPMAAGNDGMLPDLVALKGVVTKAAAEAFGRGAVSRVAITRAEPA
ncbi:MAG TPA: hypothetical protein VFQ57_02945 [Sphingomonas sp.]|nr:hypothetical protein [Sphingomonas sp.]